MKSLIIRCPIFRTAKKNYFYERPKIEIDMVVKLRRGLSRSCYEGHILPASARQSTRDPTLCCLNLSVHY